MSKILVVDDEQSICWGLTRMGESLGHEVLAASSAEQALVRAKQKQPDVIILDVRLPGMDGLSAIERFQELCLNVPIIVITAYGDLQTAVDAVRRGAFDYIAKPFDVAKVRGALARALASRPNQEQGSAPVIPRPVEGMVGRSPAMQEVYKQIALAASSDAPVLLVGEHGTGKELAARAIHRYSARASGPFVAVNVASLGPQLADSELFGHVRGTLTGSEPARAGLLAQADGGTLFFDDVDDVPQSTQVKLLRALEHGEVTPVGGVDPVRSNFRVISASHRNLPGLVAHGEFRHDLLVRLSALQIQLPPLRERAQDMAELADYFLDTLEKSPGTQRPKIAPETLSELQRRVWSGNLREFRNALDHATVMARGRIIIPEHLPPPIDNLSTASRSGANDAVTSAVRQWAEQNIHDASLAGMVYERLLTVIEPPLLDVAMRNHRGQCATAARTLGIHRTTLRKKLNEHHLDEDAG